MPRDWPSPDDDIPVYRWEAWLAAFVMVAVPLMLVAGWIF